MKNKVIYLGVLLILLASSCKKNNPEKIINPRDFLMGFSSWSFGPTIENVNDTYDFIFENGDIYSEQLDGNIPWTELINNEDLPESYVNELNGRANRKPLGKQLLLSISILNSDRSGIVEDLDGNIPTYNHINDSIIEEAYFSHCKYLISLFNPNYIVFAMETNELLIHSEENWEELCLLLSAVKERLKIEFPNKPITESVTLHNWFTPEVSNKVEYQEKVKQYYNQYDFMAISYYPFMTGHSTESDFQKAFDFLNKNTNLPIAIVETNHLGNDLNIEAFQLSIKSDEKEQNNYLETLLLNAHNNQYKFIIWWAHKDFDDLWETFPENVKDLGKLWRDTGLIDENNKKRKSYSTWIKIFNQ